MFKISKEMNRKLTAVFVGVFLFLFLVAFVSWLLTIFEVTPYGKLVAEFFKSKSNDETNAHIAANRELFDRMLPEATRFSNLYIMPAAAFVTGLVVGLIAGSGRVATALVTVGIMAFFMVKKTQGGGLAYLLLLFVFAAAGALLSERLSAGREDKGTDRVET